MAGSIAAEHQNLWRISRFLFIRGVGICYLIAYISLFVQIDGLYSCNGLLPAERHIKIHSSLASFATRPSIFPVIAPVLDLLPSSVDQGAFLMSVVCLMGVLLSLCVALNVTSNSAVLFVLYAGYLSMLSVGQTFMHFQWDILLIETGAIAILYGDCPLGLLKKLIISPGGTDYGRTDTSLREPVHHRVVRWLVRWLLFRLMFASGITKLYSGCPTWWSLTALQWHFQSQCLPMPTSWFAHKLPGFFLKMGVAGTFYIQICVSILLFSPWRVARHVAVFFQVALMVLIAATGSYNFFNLLACVMCLNCLDDKAILSCVVPKELLSLWGCPITSPPSPSPSTPATTSPHKPPSSKRGKKAAAMNGDSRTATTRADEAHENDDNETWPIKPFWRRPEVLEVGTYVLVALAVMGGFLVLFPLDHVAQGRLRFNIDDLRRFVVLVVPTLTLTQLWVMIVGGAVGLIWLTVHQREELAQRRISRWASVGTVSWALFVCTAAIALFLNSMMPFYQGLEMEVPSVHGTQRRGRDLSKPALYFLHPPELLTTGLHRRTAPFQLTASYGLFRRMTGVGGRPELTIEGYDPERRQWLEYEFAYKPGREDTRPAIAQPHQPRLDWQMWFASLGRYQENGWLVHLVYKLLHNDPHASRLLKSNPFLPKEHPANTHQQHMLPLVMGLWKQLVGLLGGPKASEGKVGVIEHTERLPAALRILKWNYEFTDRWRTHEWWNRTNPAIYLHEVRKEDLEELREGQGWPQLTKPTIADGINVNTDPSELTPCPINIFENFPVVELLLTVLVLVVSRRFTNVLSSGGGRQQTRRGKEAAR
ncbi:unnamed protein product [Vitrella brassicaformis CCMP3155]|uniref:Lipase maturation factor 2 n=1 Tax=Vitrella brassicaformis (strain CCMP3155) TaxID=1169540 RepID=A0A0G4FAJ8_VITBC|nr:unnamed protein product [Vitrella brassicaformis CCMP3155]|eukprot:CEM09631.1 unnamed protein product [Vitrella brassicaformis CCMP3155]